MFQNGSCDGGSRRVDQLSDVLYESGILFTIHALYDLLIAGITPDHFGAHVNADGVAVLSFLLVD